MCNTNIDVKVGDYVGCHHTYLGTVDVRRVVEVCDQSVTKETDGWITGIIDMNNYVQSFNKIAKTEKTWYQIWLCDKCHYVQDNTTKKPLAFEDRDSVYDYALRKGIDNFDIVTIRRPFSY